MRRLLLRRHHSPEHSDVCPLLLFFINDFLRRRLATKLADGHKELVEIAKKLEEKSKMETFLSSPANRCSESAQHLLQFLEKMNKYVGEITATEIQEANVADVKAKLENMLKEGAVHNEGVILATKSYKKWL